MSTTFVKGECRHCAGHLEFPATATGESIECPHCGQPTELVAASRNKSSGKSRMAGLAITVVIVIGLAGALFIFKTSEQTAPSQKPTPSTNSSITSAAETVSTPTIQDEIKTNEFGISTTKLEKTSGSSLVYVTGKIRNLTDRQRFGVKLEFELFDTNDGPVGKATDYQQVLEPHGEWAFKALVLNSKTATVRFNSIHEDQ